MRSICKKGTVALAAALMLCVVASASASASAAGWYVGGKAMSGTEKLAETVKVEESIVFTAKEGTQEAEAKLTCTGLKLPSTAKVGAPGTLTLERVNFQHCKFVGPWNCEIEGEGPEGVEISSNALLATLSTGKSPEDTAELGGTGSTKTWFDLPLSPVNFCVIGEGEIPVKGTVTLKAPKGQTETVEQEFVGEGEASKGLKIEDSLAYFTGKFKLKLASGKAWSFH